LGDFWPEDVRASSFPTVESECVKDFDVQRIVWK
jgi:hypothetical protein